MYSMTGFGKADFISKVGKFSVEISSVNNRFMEISTRLPRQFFSLESKVRDLISISINRGKIKVFVNFEESDESPDKYLINESALKAYLRQLETLKKKYNISGDIAIKDLLLLPEVAEPEKDSIDESIYWPALEKCLKKAVDELTNQRKAEGSEMKKDMTARVLFLESELTKIKKLTQNSVIAKKERLTKKIKELLDSQSFDPMRLEEEIAIFAEKIDITEECTRLESHFKLYKNTLKLKEPVGKQLNFILQEMNRETNTIASKSSETNISSIIINMKNEIEKIRELVQNVE